MINRCLLSLIYHSILTPSSLNAISGLRANEDDADVYSIVYDLLQLQPTVNSLIH